MRNCLCFSLRRAARTLTQFYDAELRRHGIRPTQTPIPCRPGGEAFLSMEDLSEWLGVERTTISCVTCGLWVRDGFIKIEGAGRGNRVSVSLTAKGTKELEAVEPAWRSAQDAAVNALGEQRWADFLADLERAVSSLN